MRPKETLACLMGALLLLVACSRTKNKNDFARWMDTHKPALSAKGEDCVGNAFTYTYVPRAWVACQGEVTPEEIDRERLMLDLRLAAPAPNASAYNDRLVQYADLAMKDDFVLLYGSEKRACRVVQIESNFTVPGRYKFVLFFDGIWTPDFSDSIRILYNGAVFGCSGKPVEAAFENLDLSDIPEIDCKP